MDNYIYCKIKKGTYSLKQAVHLVYDDLVSHLKKYGYHPDKICQNIWSHKSRRTKFCLCVDDFGVKYFLNEDREHLCNALKQKYDITTDNSGGKNCGLSLSWNYTHGNVDVSMPNFVQKTLDKLNYTPTKKKQFAPHEWTIPIYGKNCQFAKSQDTTPLLNSKGKKSV